MMEWPENPNIVFIFPDQLSARWLSCYGNSTVESPNLDRMAGQSVRFDRAYTNIPLCTPYRACFLTGKYPSQTGVRENGMRLPGGHMTLPELLNDSGYATYYVGKWHLSGDPQENRWVPPDQRAGFQNFVGWESHHVDHYDGLIWRDAPDEPIELAGHETDGLTSIAREELADAASSEKPFFMCISYQAPHPPCTPPDTYKDRYGSGVVGEPPSTDRDSWFKNSGWDADYGVKEFRQRYFGEISHLDAAIGRVMTSLEELGLSDETVVVFTSDHGEMCGCHGLFGKGVMYDEAIRVPLLVRMPGEGAEHKVDRPVSTVDLFPTILEIAGAEIPEGAEGESCLGIIEGRDLSVEPRDVYIEHKDDCVVREHLKVTTERDSNQVKQCFDLEKDPYEEHNLAGTLDSSIRTDMLRSLNQWRERVR
ncbi:MAG: sulfatase-like hydrolase/transferase [Planctomycetota bacterium]